MKSENLKMRMDCRLTIFTLAITFALSIFGAFQFTLYSVSSSAKRKINERNQNNGTVLIQLLSNRESTAVQSAEADMTVAGTDGESSTSNDNGMHNTPLLADTVSPIEFKKPTLKYFIIEPPEYTSSLLTDKNGVSDSYYKFALNEESAEIWLHRAFQQLIYEEGHTIDPSEADVFLIAGYLHLNLATPPRPELGNQTEMIQLYKDKIVNKTKPHLLLTPTWNPGRSQKTGVAPLTDALQKDGVNMWSVGIERNKSWQGLPPNRILPIPYVVQQSLEQRNDKSSLTDKIENSVFYAGDARRNAQGWAGCHREEMILPLKENSTLPNVDVRIVDKKNRLDQAEYNHRMITSEYCLILCGDTPTSRSLASAWVSGCIPIMVGSRLRGLCEPPCQARFGWAATGKEYPHFCFPDRIPWKDFPEVDESKFTLHGDQVLQQVFSQYDKAKKQELRRTMMQVRDGWIYGWGDPVTSTSFGQVHKYLWEEFEKLVLVQ
ncbi:unnamed protein product [Cylindrotheca closterium]|uniref:Exostosin GT47 domain-containing protein n=1 Tax=Cylindrotheca closterium TaxID=2856 RepID=A0AAD2JQ56_9STRA|nr:unnamed protein product [Cylindrotheca closterium]